MSTKVIAIAVFHNVRVTVMDLTGGDQVPWTEDGIHDRSV